METARANPDHEHLRLLSVFHYVVAGIAFLFSLFPILHLAIGIAIVTGKLGSSKGEPPPEVFGWIFILFAAAWILAGMAYAFCLALAGRALRSRTRYLFCLVMAALSCMFMPFGTVLGVFTIIVLLRESVKAQFAAASAAAKGEVEGLGRRRD